MVNGWSGWIQQLQAIAQTGLTFASDQYDIERYEAIRRLAAEMAAQVSGVPSSQIVELFAAQAGYTTPKVDVRAVVFNDAGQLLLVRERSDGLWTLPGGWADVGDTPAGAVAREVLEESGYQVEVVKLLACLDRDRQGHPPLAFAVYKLFFQCVITSGTPQSNNEISEIDFFDEETIPPLSTTRVTNAEIARCFQHAKHPEWPTDFD